MTTEVRVPTLGESVTEATVATWFKKPGDAPLPRTKCSVSWRPTRSPSRCPLPPPAYWPILSPMKATPSAWMRCWPISLPMAQLRHQPGRRGSGPCCQPPADAGAATDVMVPTLGESVTEATVSVWFKKVGDTVAQDEMLCELETDKVSVEVPAPAAGVLTEITAAEGATVEANAKLGVIAGSGAAVAAAPTAAPAASCSPGCRRWQGHRQCAIGGKGHGRGRL